MKKTVKLLAVVALTQGCALYAPEMMFDNHPALQRAEMPVARHGEDQPITAEERAAQEKADMLYGYGMDRLQWGIDENPEMEKLSLTDGERSLAEQAGRKQNYQQQLQSAQRRNAYLDSLSEQDKQAIALQYDNEIAERQLKYIYRTTENERQEEYGADATAEYTGVRPETARDRRIRAELDEFYKQHPDRAPRSRNFAMPEYPDSYDFR